MKAISSVKNDTDIKRDVLEEIECDPCARLHDLEVEVRGGLVTLTGWAPHFSARWAALNAAKGVSGVRGLTDHIEVRLPPTPIRTDGDVAGAAEQQLYWCTLLPHGLVRVTVKDGCLSLRGEVPFWYQRNAAEQAVLHLVGVQNVVNLLTIKPTANSGRIQTAIESAFRRSALLDAEAISVDTSESKVTLNGSVRSYLQLEAAERAAWGAEGVTSVDNRILVL